MEYGIAAAITAIFIVLYFFKRSPNRESFCSKLSEADFSARAKEYAQNLGLPDKGGKKQYTVKSFISQINKTERQLRRALGIRKGQLVNLVNKETIVKEIDNLDKDGLELLKSYLSLVELNKNTLKQLKKADYSALSDLPDVKGEARIVGIYRFYLENCGFLLVEDRLHILFEELNRIRTITYPEIACSKTALDFLFLEKLSYLALRISALIKLRGVSRKICARVNSCEQMKKYKQVKENKCFLYFCARQRGENCEELEKAFQKTTSEIISLADTLFENVKNKDLFAFESYYSPLELLDCFDVFSRASSEIKNGFLCDMSEQALKINLDEYAYAYSLSKLAVRGERIRYHAKRLNSAFGRLLFLRIKKDMSLLFKCLTSDDFCSLCYAKPLNKGKSITKIPVFENTFAPYTEKNSVNFGISLQDDTLSFQPKLADGVRSATFLLEHKGVEHTVNICRSNVNLLRVNGTVLNGITTVKLKSNPLTIDISIT